MSLKYISCFFLSDKFYETIYLKEVVNVSTSNRSRVLLWAGHNSVSLSSLRDQINEYQACF